MKKVINVIIVLLIIIAIVLGYYILKQYMQNSENEKKVEEVIAQIEEQLGNEVTDSTQEIPYIEYEGYQVIGTIKIDKIGIEYPILNVSNEDSMKKSVTKFWGDKVNEIGNLTISGHNYLDGTMFGNIKKLEIGDKIEILDLYNNTVTYEIFDKYVTDPDDVTVVKPREENTKEITLITCTNGNKNRLIIKAREIV